MLTVRQYLLERRRRAVVQVRGRSVHAEKRRNVEAAEAEHVGLRIEGSNAPFLLAFATLGLQRAAGQSVTIGGAFRYMDRLPLALLVPIPSYLLQS